MYVCMYVCIYICNRSVNTIVYVQVLNNVMDITDFDQSPKINNSGTFVSFMSWSFMS